MTEPAQTLRHSDEQLLLTRLAAADINNGAVTVEDCRQYWWDTKVPEFFGAHRPVLHAEWLPLLSLAARLLEPVRAEELYDAFIGDWDLGQTLLFNPYRTNLQAAVLLAPTPHGLTAHRILDGIVGTETWMLESAPFWLYQIARTADADVLERVRPMGDALYGLVSQYHWSSCTELSPEDVRRAFYLALCANDGTGYRGVAEDPDGVVARFEQESALREMLPIYVYDGKFFSQMYLARQAYDIRRQVRDGTLQLGPDFGIRTQGMISNQEDITDILWTCTLACMSRQTFERVGGWGYEAITHGTRERRAVEK